MRMTIEYNTRFPAIIFLVTAILFFTFVFFSINKQVTSYNSSPGFGTQNIINCAPEKIQKITDGTLEEVVINDNRKPAGEFRNGVYYINLEARTGYWYPETHDGAPIKINAFAEAGKPLQVPGPLIRVPEKTLIKATVRNSIKGQLLLYGFITRPGNFRDSIIINEGETKEIVFNAGNAGTFIYTVRNTDEKLIPPSIIATIMNSQLYGAFIIDPAGQQPDSKERIFMIGMCGDSSNKINKLPEYVMNGRSWPYTERLQYEQGDTVNWRVINASPLIHPMHLHGFPFMVNSLGAGGKDSVVQDEKKRLVVTQFLTTVNLAMRMSWVAEREGNWLFHCHLIDHIMPESFLRKQPTQHALMNLQTHAHEGMGGLIMGINIKPNKKSAKKNVKKNIPERELTLLIGDKPLNDFQNVHGKGFQLLEKGTPVSKQFHIPGPPIILTKDQPVAIKVINTLKEPTTIHWHGLEIDSYYDGAAGWGNEGKKLAPLIMPGDSFTVHISPPRAGTFMYHTHMHDMQLLDGLYGPLIVLEPGKKYDAEKDKLFLVSQGGATPVFTKDWAHGFSGINYLLNGSNKPPTMYLKKGMSYRFRVINISAQEPEFFFSRQSGFSISLTQDNKPVKWKMTAIDGIDLPARLVELINADRVRAGHGSTKDFVFVPHKAGNYSFETRIANDLQVTQQIKVEE